LRQAIDAVGITTVLVTHEQEEAFALGDQVAVLREGRLEQVGTPPDLYERPASHFVATFVGRASVLTGTLVGANRVRVDTAEAPARVIEELMPGDAVRVVVRPEAMRFADQGGVAGTVRHRRYLGGRALFTVDASLGALEIEAPVDAAAPGDTVRVTIERAHAFAPDDT
jgi:ABC-type Fe3+/spermidine/putrescine transport system ATPase subunit